MLLHVSYKYLLCTVCSRFSSNSWAGGTFSTNRVWACHFHWPKAARKFLRPTRDTCVSFVGFWWSLASVIVSETTNLVSYNTHIRKYRYTSWCFEVIIRLHPWNQWIELQRNTNKEGYLLKVNHRFLWNFLVHMWDQSLTNLLDNLRGRNNQRNQGINAVSRRTFYCEPYISDHILVNSKLHHE